MKSPFPQARFSNGLKSQFQHWKNRHFMRSFQRMLNPTLVGVPSLGGEHVKP
jgi:hypothetical protein